VRPTFFARHVRAVQVLRSWLGGRAHARWAEIRTFQEQALWPFNLRIPGRAWATRRKARAGGGVRGSPLRHRVQKLERYIDRGGWARPNEPTATRGGVSFEGDGSTRLRSVRPASGCTSGGLARVLEPMWAVPPRANGRWATSSSGAAHGRLNGPRSPRASTQSTRSRVDAGRRPVCSNAHRAPDAHGISNFRVEGQVCFSVLEGRPSDGAFCARAQGSVRKGRASQLRGQPTCFGSGADMRFGTSKWCGKKVASPCRRGRKRSSHT